jgi:hypothetical protein
MLKAFCPAGETMALGKQMHQRAFFMKFVQVSPTVVD